jgi:thiol-disulfide isomerase/thioredoxin
MRIFPIAATVLLLAGCQQKAPEQPANNEAAASPEGVGVKGVHREHKGEPALAGTFSDPDGKPVTLAAFKGKPVLVNLWATWCAPCVKELPTLDKLASRGSIEVLAVSQDSGPHASVVAFLKDHQIGTLKAYQDDKMALSGAVGPDTVLPTSILIGADGKEVWRYVGDLDWTSPEAAKLLSEAGAAAATG